MILTRSIHRVTCWVVLAHLMVGCGGGGGGGSGGVDLSFSPRQLTATVPQYESAIVSVTASVSGEVPNPLYVVISNADAVVEPDISIDPIDARRVTATFVIREDLSAGVRSGAMDVALCGDPACARRVGS